MAENENIRTKILKIFWSIISSPFRVLLCILFKKEQREIKWYEKIPRNIISACLYYIAGCGLLYFIVGAGNGEKEVPLENIGFLGPLDIMAITIVSYIIARRLSVRKVCENCHLNRGVKHIRKELVHSGNWVPVQRSGTDFYEQENVYKHYYKCKECGWGYTTQAIETKTKKR